MARILEWVAIPFSWGSSKSGIKPRCLALQADSLQSEPSEMQGEAGPGHLSTGLGEILGFYSESLKLLENLKFKKKKHYMISFIFLKPSLAEAFIKEQK